MDAIALLTETFAPFRGKRLLDIGCGAGHLSKALSVLGAEMTGIDPSPSAVAAARKAAPEARFEVAPAEALPFGDGYFDGAVFLNALHHIPDGRMIAALLEAGRVVGRGHPVAIVEPLPEGSFFQALRPIEDETEVRLAAQRAIASALAEGPLRRIRGEVFLRRDRFADFEAFLVRATAADPARRDLVARDPDRFRAAFRRAAALDPDGRYVLDQPLRIDILAL